MFQLLNTDFIKNRRVQLCTLFGLILELSTLGTMFHTLSLFGLPYCFSVALNYLLNLTKSQPKAYISEQYRQGISTRKMRR